MNDDNKMILKATFSIDDSYDSDKFIKLNLDLMHDGINRNKSRFFKEGLEKAKNSLFNSPILGHVVENEDGEKDFGSHDSHLEKTEDGVKEIYDEIPIGVVPESAKYEVVYDEDLDTYYAKSECYIWKNYSNYAEDIINKNKGATLSVEIGVISGKFNNTDKIYDVYEYKYLGVTFLGSDHTPGMVNAKASFSMDNRSLYEKIKELLEEELHSNGKGGSQLKDEKKMGFNNDENPEAKITEDTPTSENEPEENTTHEFSMEFTSYNDKRRSLAKALDGIDENTPSLYSTHYLIDFDDSQVIFERCYDMKDAETGKWSYGHAYYKRSYAITDNVCTLGSDEVEVFSKFLTQADIDLLESQNVQLMEENKSLKEFKENALFTEKSESIKAVFAQFDEKLCGLEEYQNYKNTVLGFEKEQMIAVETKDIEDKCYSMVGRLSFSAANTNEQTGSVQIPYEPNDGTTNHEDYLGVSPEVAEYLQKFYTGGNE